MFISTTLELLLYGIERGEQRNVLHTTKLKISPFSVREKESVAIGAVQATEDWGFPRYASKPIYSERNAFSLPKASPLRVIMPNSLHYIYIIAYLI